MFAGPGPRPEHELRLRPGERRRAAAADALEHATASSCSTRTRRASGRSGSEADRGPESDNPLDRWVIARASELARDCRAALDAYDTPSMTRAVEAFWDDLSNWYVRRSRPRFWEGDRAGLRDAAPRARAVPAHHGPGDAVPRRRDVGEPGRDAAAGRTRRPRCTSPAIPSRTRRASRAGLLGADGRRARGLRARAPRARRGQAARAPAARLGGRGVCRRRRASRRCSAACSDEIARRAQRQGRDHDDRSREPRRAAGRAQLPRARPAPRREGAGGARGARGGRLRARRRRRRRGRGRAARARRVRAALARARGLRGADRRDARGRDRHARDRGARARGHRARRRALPPERAQGARLRRLRSHRRQLRRPTSAAPRCSTRTAPGSRARCSRSASRPATAASTASPSGGAEIAFAVARA